MAEKTKKGGGNRKHGRNRAWCKQYRDQWRRETNKRRKINRHLKKHPEDRQAKQALNRVFDKRKAA